MFGAGIALTMSSALAQAVSVKDLLEARGLLGTWAIDCGAEVSAGNPYVVFRSVESYVQHDTMTGATQLRPETGLFFGSDLDHNGARHGRFSGAIRSMSIFPVSLLETAVASTTLPYCPIYLWSDLDGVPSSTR